MINIYDLRRKLEGLKVQKQHILRLNDSSTHKIEVLKREIQFSEESQIIIQLVAKKTQEELEYRLAELVTLSMNAVFEESYELRVEFVIKRGKTECNLLFGRGRNTFDPMSSCGGGVIDVAAFALKIAVWSLSQPRTRSVLILDEPFRFLSVKLQPKAALVLQELSKRLNLQVIMVSHSQILIEGADRIFSVKKLQGKSIVERSGV